MIVSKIINSERIEGLHPRFKQLFDFIKSNNLLSMHLGRISLDGDNLFINNVLVNGVDKSLQILEMHQDYIDVHVLLKGHEVIGWKPLSEIKAYTHQYVHDTDCALSDDKPIQYFDLNEGDFAIAFPEDAHAPAISDGKIRKLIGKVRM
ncbi:MAG: YhcH/YjgK/YiaL family protein [Muribaculaceae bacterium]